MLLKQLTNMPSQNHSKHFCVLTVMNVLPSCCCKMCQCVMLTPRYPVILSIENHCTVPQQKKMAEYLREVLQDKLDLTNVNVQECKKLPSPEILKGKVLVKVQRL